jgi:hypothetical protein
MSVAFQQDMKLPRVVKRTHLGMVDAYVVSDEDLFTTYMPWTIQPLTEEMQISGFMDDQGKIHYEFNHSLFDPFKYLNWKSFLRPKLFYDGLVREFLGTSLLKDEKRLIAGGHSMFHFGKKENHLLNLMILPKARIPDVDPQLRKEAIFIFQKSFDRLTLRMGGIEERTATLVIPDARMQALGWRPVKPKSLKERWERMKEFWPISLRKFQRIYVKPVEGGPSNLGFEGTR